MSDAICSTSGCCGTARARGLCDSCYGKRRRAGSLEVLDRSRLHRITSWDGAAKVGICTQCGTAPIRVRTDGRRPECRTRYMADRVGRTARRPEWRKWLRKKYRIDEDDWHTLLVAQSGRCGICGTPPLEPCVDHCHESGRVRGLLCHLCNRGIGFLGDSPERLAAALRYLT